MERLTWLFRLLDRTSGPLGRMSRSLRTYQRELNRAKKLDASDPTKRTRKGAIETAAKLYLVVTAAKAVTAALGGIASATVGAIKSLGSLFYEVTKFGVESAMTKESSLATLETIFGNKKDAKEYFNNLVRFASATPLETETVLKVGKNLKAFGLQNEDAFALLKAGGDLASIQGGGKELTERIFMAFGQIKAKDKLMAEELVGQLAEAGLDSSKVYALAAKEFGVSVDKARKLFQKGEVKGLQGLYFITEAIKQQTGGTLGKLMEKNAATVQGLLSTIKSRPFELFMDLDTTKGYGDFKGFLENLITATDPRGLGASIKKNLLGGVSDILGFTFGDLAGQGGALKINYAINLVVAGFFELWQSISRVISTIGSTVDRFLLRLGGGDRYKGIEAFFKGLFGLFEALTKGLSKMIEAIGQIAEVAVALGVKFGIIDGRTQLQKDIDARADQLRAGAVGKAGTFDPFGGKASAEYLGAQYAATSQVLREKYYQAGLDAAEGFKRGSWQGMLAAGLASAEAAGLGVREGLDINSPSKVFEYFGLMSGRGFNRGLASATAAGLSLSIPSPASLAEGARSLSGGAPSVSVVVNVSGGESARETGESVRRAVVEALGEAFEGLGIELGVAPA